MTDYLGSVRQIVRDAGGYGLEVFDVGVLVGFYWDGTTAPGTDHCCLVLGK